MKALAIRFLSLPSHSIGVCRPLEGRGVQHPVCRSARPLLDILPSNHLRCLGFGAAAPRIAVDGTRLFRLPKRSRGSAPSDDKFTPEQHWCTRRVERASDTASHQV